MTIDEFLLARNAKPISSVIRPLSLSRKQPRESNNIANSVFLLLNQSINYSLAISIMKLLATFLLLAAAVTACSDPAYRCKNPQGTKSSDYSKTVEICSEVAYGASMCYCYGAAEEYCYLEDAEKVKKFIDYCKRDDPWYAAAC